MVIVIKDVTVHNVNKLNQKEMQMPKYIMIDEKVHMIVRPVKSLFNSSLIHDVVTTGGHFVVDMETGNLTIYRKTRTKSVVWYSRDDGTFKRLANDLDVALLQIADEFEVGNIHGNLFISGEQENKIHATELSLTAFSKNVAEFYKRYVIK